MLQDLHAHVKNLLSEIMSDFINLNHVRNSNPFTIDIHDVKLRVPLNKCILESMQLKHYRNNPHAVMQRALKSSNRVVKHS